MTTAASEAPAGAAGNDAVDRAVLWLYLATEEAIRAAAVGDDDAARQVMHRAARVGAALAVTGTVSDEVVARWSEDSTLALAARGIGRVSVAPWWDQPASGIEGQHDRPSAGTAPAMAYLRWLASGLIAGWPRPVPDRSAVIAAVIDAFRSAGAIEGQEPGSFVDEVRAAVASGRFPRSWPSPPPPGPSLRGEVSAGSLVIDGRCGRYRALSVTADPHGWEVGLERLEGSSATADPWWAVDDRGGLYFGSMSGVTGHEPRVELRPPLQAGATLVVVHHGVFPAPAVVTFSLGGLEVAP